MKRLLLSVLLIAGLSVGCAQNYYNVPTEHFADKVKVLGVAPLFIDVDSDIRHPQKDQLVSLIAELNQNYEALLVRKLRGTGNFYAVTALEGEPGQLFTSLFSRREKRDDATIMYNKYFWKNDELRTYIQKNNLDAVMLVTVSGLTKKETLFSSNLLAKLEADYNFLTMTAQILDANGTILWEYPNFRSRLLTYYPLVNLQYADFSESEANLSDRTEVKFKNLEGIRRALEQKNKDWMLQETQEPEIYAKQFAEMVSLIKYDIKNAVKGPAPEDVKMLPSPAAVTKPAESQALPAVVPPVPIPAAPSPESPAPQSDEIVPATGSTL